MNLRVKTTKAYDKGILQEATRSTPIHATCTGHAQSVTGVHMSFRAKISPVCIRHTLKTSLDIFYMLNDVRNQQPHAYKTHPSATQNFVPVHSSAGI